MCHPPPVSYWRLWTSSALSNLADGVFKVALPLVAIDYTRSPVLVAGVSFAAALPWLLCALPAGALADRLDRRHAMLAANAARAALLAALAFGAGSIWVLYAIAFCVGVAETLYDTSAQSIVPQVVPRADLSRANARLYAVEMTANEFVGPPLGGLLAGAGTLVAFATPAGLWVAAIGALLLLRGDYRPARTHRATMRADIVEGLRFLWHRNLLRTFAIAVGVSNFASNARMAVLVLYAVGAMGLTETEYGILLTTSAAGSLVGSFAAPAIERALGRSRSILAAFLVIALSIAAPTLTPNPWLVGAGFFIGGVGIMLSNVILVSLRQRITPDHILGRVNSAYRLVAWGTIPLGAATGGLLAQWLGLRPVFAIAGALTLLLLIPISRFTDPVLDAAERDAGA
ncbi:putative MFS family arabinose efflux permease [Actinokineospora auranticolor]|uniref:Putative MFS family arabinose efflux permease n=1 Tax=Actinokineospora auranticolor TaxID=155976 RepID=A0A2S6GCH2_9PSEU|nr:putative MFS family arabinose efflux permease [Actinokineospora auranticolor]